MNIEDYTMTNILASMLSRISDTLDKREGSIIYDALAPAAFELSQAYKVLAETLAMSFAATAAGDYLDLRVGELGMTRKPAVKAVRYGSFLSADEEPLTVALGSRFSTLDGTESLNFVVIEAQEDGTYALEAEEAGVVGNGYQGQLLPIDHQADLVSATLYGDPIIPGEDEESDEELRARYFYYISHEPKNGSVAQYEYWANSYSGIGRAKVFPIWNGANTVKVSILDSSYQQARPELVAAFQEYLDPGGSGLGNGMAPIGAVVTVTTAAPKTIKVAATITLAGGYTLAQAETLAATAIKDYYKEAAYTKTTINAIGIGAALLELPAIESVSTLTLNGAAYVSLGAEEIPLSGDLILEVSP